MIWFKKLLLPFVILLVAGCGGVAPVPKLQEQKVVKKVSKYTKSINAFGEMAEIYNSPELHVQTKGVIDDTGISKGISSTGEIPYDVTEMIKSAVNNIGKKVILIDYDPSHQSNMMALGYTQFQNKIKPDLVISGGITEYDRALLSTKTGANTDLVKGNFGLDASASSASSVDRITVDINLIDFDTWAMIPKMNATNSIKVYMGRNSVSFGFSILSNNFGLDGSAKEIQGRHAAVRMLIDMSIVEVLGRNLNLPYWRILPNGQEDSVVIKNIRNKFESADEEARIVMIQRALYLHGYDIEIDGKLNSTTLEAIDDFASKHGMASNGVQRSLFEKLYLSVPLKNNFRSMAIFDPLSTQTTEDQNSNPSIATPNQSASKEIAQSPQDLVSFQEILSDKKIVATGIYKHKNEMIALQMATNIAINNLAKKIGTVLQEEETTLQNEKVNLIMKTHAQNIVNGYEKIEEKYNNRTGRAEITIQLEGSVLAGTLEQLLH